VFYAPSFDLVWMVLPALAFESLRFSSYSVGCSVTEAFFSVFDLFTAMISKNSLDELKVMRTKLDPYFINRIPIVVW
jgi:hypothetical protein